LLIELSAFIALSLLLRQDAPGLITNDFVSGEAAMAELLLRVRTGDILLELPDQAGTLVSLRKSKKISRTLDTRPADRSKCEEIGCTKLMEEEEEEEEPKKKEEEEKVFKLWRR
jgi:hypothetical protein